jgi:hypothetical protein
MTLSLDSGNINVNGTHHRSRYDYRPIIIESSDGLMAQPALAYPSRPKEALLPTVAEMGEIFRRAWVVDDIPATVL